MVLAIALTCNDDAKEKIEDQIKIWISEVADYENWCGPFNNIKGTPADSLDECCQAHDERWQYAKNDPAYLTCGEGLRSELDAELVDCVENLDDNTDNWENPPVDSDEANWYIELILTVFSPCMAEL